MDDFLLLSYREHLTLQKFKKSLESQHNVKINMPVINSNESGTEVTFTSISGDVKNISNVKNFLKRKTSELQENDESIIILSSNSDDETVQKIESSVTNRRKFKKRRKRTPRCDQNTSIEIIDVCQTPSLSFNPTISHRPAEVFIVDNTDNNQSVILIEPSTEKNTEDSKIVTSTNENVKLNDTVPKEVEILAEDFISLTPSRKKSNDIECISVQNITADFIPLTSNIKNKKSNENSSEGDSDIIELSSDEDGEPIPLVPRKLRPVVIDGSNVARSHGKPTNTYSCMGIKICVDYFLKRGHTQVTAFVPKFRQHCKKGNVISTDSEILEELEKKQHVVFTPSRRLNHGKSYSCYDDRFIVEYASLNGGVILSNDNYKDLMDESAAFKETIEKRLLMFCFVGDTLMIPADPLGSKGPSLEEFLSFPPEDD